MLDAILAGHIIDVSTSIVTENIDVAISTVDRIDDLTACVGFQKIIPVTIVITDLTTGVVLSTFSTTVQVFDNVSLCFPLNMPVSAIHVTASAAEAIVLSTVPFDGQLTFEFSICQDIQVTLDILARVQIEGFCESRQGIPCRGSVVCTAGPAVYPSQCSARS